MFPRRSLLGRGIKTKRLFTVAAGDFVISRMQAVHGATASITSEYDGYHVSGSYSVLVPREPVAVDPAFLDRLMQLPSSRALVLRSAHGVHIEKMTFDLDRFLTRRVFLPPTVHEQQSIAQLIAVFERDATLVQAELKALSRQRLAVMQRLLTGQREVPS